MFVRETFQMLVTDPYNKNQQDALFLNFIW